MIKLYEVYSTTDNFEAHDGVLVHWFCIGREQPLVDYAEVIEDYDPEDDHRFYPQGLIDELFTEQEAKELADYLSKLDTDVRVYEKKLPIGWNIMGVSAIPTGGPQGTIYFPEGSPLDIDVRGYYDLRQAVDHVGSYKMEHGENFIKQALFELDLSLPEGADLEKAVTNIYYETGLQVSKGMTRSEKLERKNTWREGEEVVF